MPKALNVDWQPIKQEYLKGEKSLREVAAQYGISEAALEKRCSRESWNDDRSAIIKKVTKEVSAKLSERLENEAEGWVKETLFRCHRVRKDIDKVRKSFPLNMTRLETETKVEARIDSIARRSLGLADTPQVLALASDSPEFQNQILSQLESVRKMVESGRVEPKTIDVEAIVEMAKDIEKI